MRKIYAITEGSYSDYRIIALTLDKQKAQNIAKMYDGEVEEYIDAELEDNVNPRWCVRFGCLGSYKTYKSYDDGYRGEGVHKDVIGDAYYVYVRAKDDEHAEKKAQDMLAMYKAEREGII